MSLINGLVDGHPVNVVHMCAVHGGAEESTSVFQQHCEGSFWKSQWWWWGGCVRVETEWNLEVFGLFCCEGGWMRAGAVQPATWDVLTRNNGGLSVALNPLVACWERAAVRPPLTTDTLSGLLNFCSRESQPFFLLWCPLQHVVLTETLPGVTSSARVQSTFKYVLTAWTHCQAGCPEV